MTWRKLSMCKKKEKLLLRLDVVACIDYDKREWWLIKTIVNSYIARHKMIKWKSCFKMDIWKGNYFSLWRYKNFPSFFQIIITCKIYCLKFLICNIVQDISKEGISYYIKLKGYDTHYVSKHITKYFNIFLSKCKRVLSMSSAFINNC